MFKSPFARLSIGCRVAAIAGALTAVTLPATVAQASPLITLKVEAFNVTKGESEYSSSVVAGIGDVLSFRILADMAGTGISNTQGSTTRTITSLTPGTDGANGLKFDLFQSSADTLQASIATSSLDGDYDDGTGPSAGALTARGNGSFDLLNIRPIRATGSFGAIDPDVLLTGTITVNSAGSSGTLALRGPATAANAGSVKINGSTTVFITNTTESSGDPVMGFAGLTITDGTAVPEPASLGLLALGALMAARRRGRTA